MKISGLRHPNYLANEYDFTIWRDTYDAGEVFLRRYLERFSKLETEQDYRLRSNLTPIPGFASSVVKEISKSIFQRLTGVSRTNGTLEYQKAVQGEGSGVDRFGSSMNAFIGKHLLTEMLVMQVVGVYVDNSPITSPVLGVGQKQTPYIYAYRREDILSWKYSEIGSESEFQSVLLRDYSPSFHESGLPLEDKPTFRLLWIDENGYVNVRIMDANDNDIVEPRVLQLRQIPFVLFDCGDSIIRTVCRHQIALLNLTSNDVWYALKSNHTFYVEQGDTRQGGGHLKPNNAGAADDFATGGTAGVGSNDNEISVGATRGRIYQLNSDQPAFINPSSEPLVASMKLQEKLESDIRRLVNLAVESLGGGPVDENLHSGLSFIGLILEAGERKIANFWAAYEQSAVDKRKLPLISYPNEYKIKTDEARISEALELSKIVYNIPSKSAKREVAKMMANVLMVGRVPSEKLEAIYGEVDKSKYLTSDPKTIFGAVEHGLCGNQSGSIALGFDDNEYLVAIEDHAKRLAVIRESQSSDALPNGGSRGIPDLSTNPSIDAKAEKELSRDSDLDDVAKLKVRGEGK